MVNETCFSSEREFRTYIAALSPGMAEGDILAGLCSRQEVLVKLNRQEMKEALVGDAASPLPDSDLVKSLYGYRLNYRDVHLRHGFSSPIRIETKESGYSYTVTLIFLDGRLFEEPVLSGGLVSNSSTRTLFDYITPGTVLQYGR